MSLVAALELDLEIFTGPFDLLLAVLLREEVDLLELSLAEVVLAYLDHLEGRDELDLEAATEFLVLMAALLELKSRLMLGGGEEEDVEELEPLQAAEELLERMVEALRYRGAGAHLRELLAAQEGVRFRDQPVPARLRSAEAPSGTVLDPALLGRAIGDLLRRPPAISLHHMGAPRVTVRERLDHLRGLLRAGRPVSFEQAVAGADRVTVAVTVFALLELYKRGEVSWEQSESFGDIAILPAARGEEALP